MRLGDDYIKALSESFPYADHLSEIVLSHNRLTTKGINSVLYSVMENKNLLKKIQHLNLSYNKLSTHAIKTLCDFLDDQYSEVKEINLEANCIGDMQMIQICESITKSLVDKLTYLNVGQNMISDNSCANIASLLRDCLNLEVLIIYWNHLRNFGGSLIMGEIKSHPSLKVLDISWNTIGENLIHEPSINEIVKSEKLKETENRNFLNVSMSEMRKTMFINVDLKVSTPAKYISPFAKALGTLFTSNTCKIVHLDISHNNLPTGDCVYLCK